MFFFLQAEDGIRDRNVTGVQTCALPIFFLAKYPFFLLRISWLIGASGSGFIFLEPPIRLADSQFANRVLGQSSNLSGYKKSPKSLIYKGFGRCALASLARFERAAFRLGVDPIRHREVASNA